MNRYQWREYYRLERFYVRFLKTRQYNEAWVARSRMGEISNDSPYNSCRSAQWLNAAATARARGDLGCWSYCMDLARQIRDRHQAPFIQWSQSAGEEAV